MMTKFGIGVVVAMALMQSVLANEATWLTDLSKAREQARQEKKLILLDFTGSDWCPTCKLLHKNVFSSKDFIHFAEKNLVLVLVDFPNSKPQSAEQKKANNRLAEKFDIVAFPTVVVLDSDGKKISVESGYQGEPAKEIVARLQKLKNEAPARKAGS
jgi:protein disulfide-isomerase